MDSCSWESVDIFTTAVRHARNLRTLCISDSCSETLLESILSFNSDLQHLRISFCDSFCLRGDITPLKSLTILELEEISSFGIPMLSPMVSMAPNLHKLRIECSVDGTMDISCLSQLGQLEEFVLNVPGLPRGSLTNLLRGSDPNCIWPHLRSLVLHGIGDEDVNFVLRFGPQLRLLHLVGCFSGPSLKSILSSLRLIEKLSLARLDTLTNAVIWALHKEARESLRELTVTACTLLSSPLMNLLIDVIPTLKSVTVSGCPDVHIEAIQEKPLLVSLGASKQYSAM